MGHFLQVFPECKVWIQTLTSQQLSQLQRSFDKISLSNWQQLKTYVCNKNTFTSAEDNWHRPACFTLEDRQIKRDQWQRMQSMGTDHLQQGKVAALTVAGGLGTRLGFKGPKGLVPITPLKHKPFFQIFAEKLKAIERKHGIRIHWFVMTSNETHAATHEAFHSNAWYESEYLHLFPQGDLPAFTLDNFCLLNDGYGVQYYPNGHGGVFKALADNGCLDLMEKYGLETISYFQIDNPLVQVCDAHFIGSHLLKGSDFSTKVVAKTQPQEKVGLFVKKKNALQLIEYSEMPIELTEKKSSQGDLYFKYGNTAIHLIQRTFLETMATKNLPIHITYKSLKHWNPMLQNLVTETCKKLEYFVFDALPFSTNPHLFEVIREEEFSPVKKAQGQDSIETCLQNQIQLWQNWLTKVADPIHLPSNLEISPLFGDDFISFKTRWEKQTTIPKIFENLYLE